MGQSPSCGAGAEGRPGQLVEGESGGSLSRLYGPVALSMP